MASKSLESDAGVLQPRRESNSQLQPVTSSHELPVASFGGHQPQQLLQQIIIKDVSHMHLGSVIHNYGQPQKPIPKQMPETKPRKVFTVTQDMKTMSKSNIPLDHDAMDIISTHMEANWKDLARKLGFSDGQIHQFVEDHYIRGLKEVVYQLLLEWKQNTNPKLGRTVKILFENKNYEVVQRLLDEYWLPREKEKFGNETTEIKSPNGMKEV